MNILTKAFEVDDRVCLQICLQGASRAAPSGLPGSAKPHELPNHDAASTSSAAAKWSAESCTASAPGKLVTKAAALAAQQPSPVDLGGNAAASADVGETDSATGKDRHHIVQIAAAVLEPAQAVSLDSCNPAQSALQDAEAVLAQEPSAADLATVALDHSSAPDAEASLEGGQNPVHATSPQQHEQGHIASADSHEQMRPAPTSADSHDSRAVQRSPSADLAAVLMTRHPAEEKDTQPLFGVFRVLLCFVTDTQL